MPRKLPAYHYPNGMPIPEAKLTRPDSIVDAYAGYLLTCHSTGSPDHFIYEVWSQSSGLRGRYAGFAAAWGHYLRLVRRAQSRDRRGLDD